MGDNPIDRLRQRMQEKATENSDAKPSSIPEGGGSMSGAREGDVRGEGSKDRDVAAGPKSMPEKQAVAEELIAEGKAKDVEDTREETSGDERHDLVIPSEPNIPPTIIQERLRMGQNPATGEPWTRQERMNYDRLQEQARQEHARAVREAEEQRRTEAAAPAPQPIPHVPVNQLTERQKRAMQEAQDRGEGPLAQARARDANAPEAIGRAEAEKNIMTKQDQLREDVGVDPEIEKNEIDPETENGDDTEKDADEVQAELDEDRQSKK